MANNLPTPDMFNNAANAPTAQPGPSLEELNTAPALPSHANGLSWDRPLQESPLDLQERLAFALGNDRGREKWLKERFADARKDADGDWTVKDDKGMWRAIDPSGLGDSGYSFAEKIAKKGEEALADMAELIPIAADIGLTAAGGAVGAAATGGVGTVAGASLAAGLTAFAKSSLGKWAGTYDAAPIEQVADAALDGLLTAGGYMITPAGIKGAKWLGKKAGDLVGLGAKKVSHIPEADEALKAIHRVTQGMTTKSRLAVEVLTMRGMPQRAGEIMVTRKGTQSIIDHSVRKMKRGIPESEVAKELLDRSGKRLASGALATRDAIFNTITPIIDKDVAEKWAKEGVKVNFSSMLDDIARDPFMQQILKPSVDKSGKIIGYGINKRLNRNFVDKELSSYLGLEKVLKKEGLLKSLNMLYRAKPLQGKDAAEMAFKLNKSLNALIGQAQGDSQKALIGLKERLMANVTEQVAGQSKIAHSAFNMRNAYLHDVWQHMEVMAQRTMTDNATRSAAVNALSGTTRDEVFTGAMANLRKNIYSHPLLRPLAGQKGGVLKDLQKGLRDISIAEEYAAAPAFLRSMPKYKASMSDLPIVGVIGGALYSGNPLVAGAAGLGAAALSSPRTQARLLRLASKGYGEQVLNSAAAHNHPAMSTMAAKLQAMKPYVIGKPELWEAGFARALSEYGQEEMQAEEAVHQLLGR